MLTYTLVLVGTIRYKYPLISPITQAVIAPFEFSVLYLFIISSNLGINYAFFAYVYWALIELSIIIVMIKQNHISRTCLVPYLLFLCVLTCVMCYLVGHKGHMFFFSYFNTFVGELIWLFHVRRTNYPMRPLALMVFIAKLLADTIAIPVYFGTSWWLIDFICVTLPILDLLFIIMFIHAKKVALLKKELQA